MGLPQNEVEQDEVMEEPAEFGDPSPAASLKVEVTIQEAEVLKISPKAGDTLLFKFKGEQFYNDDVNELGRQLRVLFPNNKVVVMSLPNDHDVELTIVENQDKVEEVAKDCSQPASYCNGCNCGKKELIEAERKQNG